MDLVFTMSIAASAHRTTEGSLINRGPSSRNTGKIKGRTENGGSQKAHETMEGTQQECHVQLLYSLRQKQRIERVRTRLVGIAPIAMLTYAVQSILALCWELLVKSCLHLLGTEIMKATRHIVPTKTAKHSTFILWIYAQGTLKYNAEEHNKVW